MGEVFMLTRKQLNRIKPYFPLSHTFFSAICIAATFIFVVDSPFCQK